MINEQKLAKHGIGTGNDSLVIRKHVSGIPGGRTLDMAGFEGDVLLAGHVVVKTKEGNYAPMPVSGAAYAALPEGASYAGVLYRSVLRSDPAASVMYDGVVNETLIPYPLGAIREAFLKACPHIILEQDEVA